MGCSERAWGHLRRMCVGSHRGPERQLPRSAPTTSAVQGVCWHQIELCTMRPPDYVDKRRLHYLEMLSQYSGRVMGRTSAGRPGPKHRPRLVGRLEAGARMRTTNEGHGGGEMDGSPSASATVPGLASLQLSRITVGARAGLRGRSAPRSHFAHLPATPRTRTDSCSPLPVISLRGGVISPRDGVISRSAA